MAGSRLYWLALNSVGHISATLKNYILQSDIARCLSALDITGIRYCEVHLRTIGEVDIAKCISALLEKYILQQSDTAKCLSAMLAKFRLNI